MTEKTDATVSASPGLLTCEPICQCGHVDVQHGESGHCTANGDDAGTPCACPAFQQCRAVEDLVQWAYEQGFARARARPASRQLSSEPRVEALIDRAGDWQARMFDYQVSGCVPTSFEAKAQEIIKDLMLCVAFAPASSIRAVIAEMLRVYGVPFTDELSRQTAIDAWAQRIAASAPPLSPDSEQLQHASDFIRAMLEAVGLQGSDRAQWQAGSWVSLKELELQVVGLIEDLKVNGGTRGTNPPIYSYADYCKEWCLTRRELLQASPASPPAGEIWTFCPVCGMQLVHNCGCRDGVTRAAP